MEDNDSLHRHGPTNYTPKVIRGRATVVGNRYTKLGMEQVVTQISPYLNRKITISKPYNESKRAFLEDILTRFLADPRPLVPTYVGKDREILRFWVSGPTHRRLRALAEKNNTTVAVIAISAITAELD